MKTSNVILKWKQAIKFIDDLLFLFIQNIYFRFRERRNRPKREFWPHDHLNEVLKKLERNQL